MTVSIEEDTRYEYGHALLHVPGVFDQAAVQGIRIERENVDDGHLGPNGWQAEPAVLAFDTVETSEAGLALGIGPAISDRLEADEQVLVELTGIGERARVFWPFVAPSPAGASGAVIGTYAPAAAVAASPIVAPIAPEPEPEPVAEPEPEPVETTPTEPHRRSKTWLVPLVALLLIAAGAAWFFRDVILPPDDVPVVETIAPAPSPTPETRAVETADWKSRYRTLREADPQGTELFALHNEIMTAPEPDDDTAFRALYDAASRGEGAAALALARLYDPATFTDRFFSRPNPARAARFYGAARDADVQGAGDALAALCDTARADPRDEDSPFAGFDDAACPPAS